MSNAAMHVLKFCGAVTAALLTIDGLDNVLIKCFPDRVDILVSGEELAARAAVSNAIWICRIPFWNIPAGEDGITLAAQDALNFIRDAITRAPLEIAEHERQQGTLQ